MLFSLMGRSLPYIHRRPYRLIAHRSLASPLQLTDEVMTKVNKIDELLENFVGIRDQELSNTVFDLAKAAKDAEVFAGKLDEQLSDFEFPDDFVLDVRWGMRCQRGDGVV